MKNTLHYSFYNTEISNNVVGNKLKTGAVPSFPIGTDLYLDSLAAPPTYAQRKFHYDGKWCNMLRNVVSIKNWYCLIVHFYRIRYKKGTKYHKTSKWQTKDLLLSIS